MAVPEHDRLTFSGIRGTLAVPLDDWSFSLNLTPHAAADTMDAAGLNALATSAQTLWATHLGTHMQTDCRTMRTRYAVMDGSGHVKTRGDGSFKQGDSPGATTGTGGSTVLPLQCALVVSLSTARSGASGKGRFFLPMPAVTPVGADKLLSEANVDALVTSVKAFLDALNGGFGAGDLVVASSKGYLTPVTGIRIGRAIDTLRSRRSQLKEGYRVAALA